MLLIFFGNILNGVYGVSGSDISTFKLSLVKGVDEIQKKLVDATKELILKLLKNVENNKSKNRQQENRNKLHD